MQLHKRFDDRKSEACAGGHVRTVLGAIEPLEHALDLLGRHPRAGVPHRELDPLAIGHHRDADASVLAGVKVSIGEQVRDDLAHARGIGECKRHRWGHVDVEALALGDDPRPHQLGHFADRLAEVDRPALELDAVGLDPRHVE